MNILAIETSTEACSAALWVDGKMFEHFEIAPRRHTDLILFMVDRLLKISQLTLKEMTAIAVGVGPGSFMGGRLAVGVAQGLAFGAGILVIPISSLQALAQRAFRQMNRDYVAPAWDARMGEIYWGAYEKKEGVMLPVKEDALSAPPCIVLPHGHDWLLVGNAWEIYRGELSPTLQGESHLFHPSAKAVAELALYAYSHGQGASPLHLEPRYVRQRVAFK